MKYTSPLERALQSRETALSKVLASLNEQMLDCLTLSRPQRQKYEFSLDEELARQAGEEYFRIMCCAENTPDRLVRDLNERGEDHHLKVFYAKGRCPETGFLVANRVRIGTDIDTSLYSRVLASPDQLLSELCEPTCAHCTDLHGKDTTHPTVLSYTRYLPEEFLPYFDKVEEREAAIARFEAQWAQAYAEGVSAKRRKSMERRASGMRSELHDATASLYRKLAAYQGKVLFSSTRIKRSARIVDKLMRIMLKESLPAFVYGNPLPQVTDIYGLKRIVRLDKDVPREVSRIERVVQENGGKVTEQPEKVHLPGHESTKLQVIYGQGEERTTVQVQVQSYKQFFHDQRTHPQYEEERQIEIADIAQRQGIPVHRFERQLRRIFSYTGKKREIPLIASEE